MSIIGTGRVGALETLDERRARQAQGIAEARIAYARSDATAWREVEVRPYRDRFVGTDGRLYRVHRGVIFEQPQHARASAWDERRSLCFTVIDDALVLLDATALSVDVPTPEPEPEAKPKRRRLRSVK